MIENGEYWVDAGSNVKVIQWIPCQHEIQGPVPCPYCRIQELENQNEWQPIATAPRDGTPVDLWHMNDFRVTEVWWDASDSCWSNLMDDEDFTHWMQVPEPPERSTSHETCHAIYPESMK